MLSPMRHCLCRALLFRLFDCALNALPHRACIVQPTGAESLSHISLQPFRPIRSLLQCNTRACSPTRGIYF